MEGSQENSLLESEYCASDRISALKGVNAALREELAASRERTKRLEDEIPTNALDEIHNLRGQNMFLWIAVASLFGTTLVAGGTACFWWRKWRFAEERNDELKQVIKGKTQSDGTVLKILPIERDSYGK